MYDDEYNRGVANTVLKRSKRKALNVDRLNGAGARTASDGDRTKHPAAYWFKQENEVFKDDITRPDVEPESVVRERSNLDLGAGRCRGGMVGMPDRGSLSNVEPNSVIRERAGLDLGAGRSGGGMSGGLWGALASLAIPLIGSLMGKGNSGGGASVVERKLLSDLKKIAMSYANKECTRAEVTKQVRQTLPRGKKNRAVAVSKVVCSIAKDYKKRGQSGRGYSGGAQEFEDKEEQYDDDEELEGGAMPLRQTGYGVSCGPAGRQVGGKVCKCKCKCGAGNSGGGMSGGYGPVAPTTESLYGYDNRNQPKGLKPPPSVNQQEGMGDAQYVGSGRKRGGRQPVSMSELGRDLLPVSQLPSGTGGGRSGGYSAHNFFAPRSAKEFFGGYEAHNFFAPRSAKEFFGGRMCPRNYDPVTDESGRTYSNKCSMDAAKSKGGKSFSNTTNYASNSGNILPAMQSRVSIGSGARSARGAMVSQLMKEKGMTLGEASRYIKEHKS
jgi:hypothetical protein